MTAPTPGRPPTSPVAPPAVDGVAPDALRVTDDLDRAYRAAVALADDGRAPAPAVRANVLAAARAVALASGAATAAGRAEEPGVGTVPGIDGGTASAEASATVAPTMPTSSQVPVAVDLAATPGRGRGLAANRSSWRLRAGAAACVAVLAAVAAWRIDGGRSPFEGRTTVAALEPSPRATPRVEPAPPLPPSVLAAPPVAERPPLLAGAARADAPARESAPVVASRGAEVARAGLPAHAARLPGIAIASAKKAAPPTSSPPDLVVAAAGPDEVARALSAAAPAPAPVAQARQAPPAASPAPPVLAMAAPSPRLAPLAEPASAPALPGAAAPAGALADGASTVVATASPPPPPAAVVADANADARLERPLGVLARRSVDPAARSRASEAAKSSPNALVRAVVGVPPLQRAADEGDAARIGRLLAAGAAVDAPDADGRTALLHAVQAQHLDAVRALLAAGADPERADRAGLTPRAAAQRGADAGIATLLDPR